MAKFVFKNAYISVNSVNLSSYVKSISINYGAEVLDNTCMGDTAKVKVVGFKDWSVDVEFAQDYAASMVDATLFPLVGADAFAIEIRPDAGVVGATNPKFTGNVLLTSYNPVTGSVNQVATTSVKMDGSGALTRAVA